MTDETKAGGSNVRLNAGLGAPLQELGNALCQTLPDGFEMAVIFEHEAAYVELTDCIEGRWVELPDAADKTLFEQVQDAIDAAHRTATNAALSGGRSPSA